MTNPLQRNIENLTPRQVQKDLAACYQIFAMLGWDDLTYTHISARVPGEAAYYIYPLGLLFEEVTASCLLKVSLDGVILEGEETQYNRTGYIMHGAVYAHRPEINGIIHLHTIDGVAVSAMKEGLLPISQFAYHFYNRLGTHAYDSLALEEGRHGSRLVEDLGSHKAMLLQNHGTLTCGENIQEAFLYMHFLEKACQVQCQTLSSKQELHIPSPQICKQAAQDMRDFESNFGSRDWEALIRKLERSGSSYAL